MKSQIPLSQSDQRTVRLFIALPMYRGLPRAEEMVQAWQQEIVSRQVHWSRRDKWHVTLQFLGEVTIEKVPTISQVLTETASQHSAQVIQLTELGGFPMGNPHALAIYVEMSEALRQLQYAVQQAMQKLGFKPDKRGYLPHVTVARGNKGTLVKLKHGLTPMAESVIVDEMVLFKSQQIPDGEACYVPLQSFPLGRTMQRDSR